MDFRRVLITGGAGFVGANLGVLFKEHFPEISVVAFDNLKRRGSELNLPRLKRSGVSFLHGDIRCREDVDGWPPFDLLIDCSAEPSVQAGLQGSPLPVIQNNLTGTVHCMEAARRKEAAFLFLSTSRVYPIARVNGLACREEATRFSWTAEERIPGFSAEGIAEGFPLDGARSLYGATKLAGELLLQEYAYTSHLPVLINRCGILTGPWQMGKVDQGVVTLWVARHLFGKPLQYIGFGGSGKQVRDMLHVEDLFRLLVTQMEKPECWDGRVYNVGAGRRISASLLELTEICRNVTQTKIPISRVPETSRVDLRVYISDSTKAKADFQWEPQHAVSHIVSDIAGWIRENRDDLAPILG